jgi:NAD(P)-dependent dehydrogenase (short-subunit alcohol dehydrogenase family)
MAYTFISGATGGLGRAFAIACAKKGYSLFIIGRSQGKISALKAEISAISSVEVLSAVCDLTSERSRKKLLAFIEEKARQRGFDRIYLETHTNLTAALHLYEKTGYREIDRPASVVHSTMNKFYLKEL